MSGHDRTCRRDFPGCLCLRCAKDGTRVDDKACCAVNRDGFLCEEFDECPGFEPERDAPGESSGPQKEAG